MQIIKLLVANEPSNASLVYVVLVFLHFKTKLQYNSFLLTYPDSDFFSLKTACICRVVLRVFYQFQDPLLNYEKHSSFALLFLAFRGTRLLAFMGYSLVSVQSARMTNEKCSPNQEWVWGDVNWNDLFPSKFHVHSQAWGAGLEKQELLDIRKSFYVSIYFQQNQL